MTLTSAILLIMFLVAELAFIMWWAQSLIRRALSQPRPPDLDQLWYWSPEWQRAEREADADTAQGNYQSFENMDDFVASLMADGANASLIGPGSGPDNTGYDGAEPDIATPFQAFTLPDNYIDPALVLSGQHSTVSGRGLIRGPQPSSLS